VLSVSASAFPLADRWFSSTLAQTDPQRRFLIAGTALGMTDDIGAGLGNAVPDATLAAPPNGTIFSRLSAANISWIDYVESYPTGATPNPSLPPSGQTAASLACSRTGPGTIPPPDSIGPAPSQSGDAVSVSGEIPASGGGAAVRLVVRFYGRRRHPRGLRVEVYTENGTLSGLSL